MRVLAIDPGYDRMGVAILDGSASTPVYVYSECITPEKSTHEVRLARLTQVVASLISEYQPDVFSIEKIFFMKNVRTALKVGEARGAILTAVGDARLPIVEYSPQQIKMAVTGYGASDKKAVAHMIPHLLKLPQKKRLDDEWDALACGICALSYRQR